MMKINQKHIDVITKYFYPITAGIETNILETYSILAKLGWEITIHTSKNTYLETNVLIEEEVIRNLTVRRYKWGIFGFSPKINWEKADLICLHNFDIFPHFWIILHSLFFKLLKRKKFILVLTPHGGFNPEWCIYSKFCAVIKKTYHYSLGKILINSNVNGIRAVSEWEKKEMVLKGINNDLIQIIENGIESEAYMDINKLASSEIRIRVKKWGKYIVQIGRIYPIKNYETTIMALAGLPKDINYVIMGPVGNEKYFKKLKALINSLGLFDRVFFVGVINGVDKYYVIKKAQLMVHMALWESFCNVIHEGLSQGLVCIVANNTALPYLVKNKINGYCVKTKDNKNLAKKILYVIKNNKSKEILEMKTRNRYFGLKNSWQEVAYKMNNFYNQLIT